MNGIWAVARKDLTLLFASPLAYAVLTAVVVATGLFFYDNLKAFNVQLMVVQAQIVMSEGMTGALPPQINLYDMVFLPTVVQSALVLLVVVPLVTMRTFAEERLERTDEFLFTLPLGLSQIIGGKFLATFLFLLATLVVAAIFPTITVVYAEIDPGPLVSVFAGMTLLSFGLASIGIFCSTLTANQLVAALGAYAFSLAIFDFAWLTEFTGETGAAALSWIALQTHFESFPRGVIPVADGLYFASLCLVGFFLSRSSLELERVR